MLVVVDLWVVLMVLGMLLWKISHLETRIEILWKKKQDMTEEVDKIKLVNVVLWKKNKDMTEEVDKIKLISAENQAGMLQQGLRHHACVERICELDDARHRFCCTVRSKNITMNDRISVLERGYTPVNAAQSAVL